jgi:acyl-CoA synthetase (NDP forming)
MLFNYLDVHHAERNLGIITVGGGSSIETTDLMEMYNLNVPALNESTKEIFRKFIPDVNTINRNPLDLGAVGIDPKIFSRMIITLDKDPNISIVVIIQFSFTRSSINEIIKAKSEMKKPLICIAPRIGDNASSFRSKLKFKEKLFQNGIPTFESTELAAKALDRVCTYKESLEKRYAI